MVDVVEDLVVDDMVVLDCADDVTAGDDVAEELDEVVEDATDEVEKLELDEDEEAWLLEELLDAAEDDELADEVED